MPPAARPIRAVAAWWGLGAIVVAFMSIAAMNAYQQPPFAPPDETAHVGYAQEIAHLHLPEITTVPHVPASATQWIAERDSARGERYLGVWVANHPPLNYVLVAPLVWLSDALGRADGGLLFLRLANVLFGAVGVALTYFLAWELSGGVRRIALASAAVVAFVPQLHRVLSQGLNDGLGFAAGTAVVWAALRWLRTGSRRDLVAARGGIGRGCRGAGVDDAARGGRRRPPRLLVPHRQRADVAPPHPSVRRGWWPWASVPPSCCSGGSTCATSSSTATSGHPMRCSSCSAAAGGGAWPRSSPPATCGSTSTMRCCRRRRWRGSGRACSR